MKIRLGCSRLVILHRTYAIKIPIFISWRRLVAGAASNYKEYFEWKRSEDPSLCKVHFCFAGLFLVADRAESVSEEEFKKIGKRQLKKLFKLMTFKDELHWDNIGKVGSRYVIIDNGIALYKPKYGRISYWLRKVRTKLGLI